MWNIWQLIFVTTVLIYCNQGIEDVTEHQISNSTRGGFKSSETYTVLHKVEVENWAWLMKVYESKLQYGTFSTCVTTDF